MRRAYFIILFFGLTYQTLLACKCNVNDDTKAGFESSEIIVHGKVINKEFVTFSSSFTGKGMELVCESYINDAQIQDFLEREFLIKVEVEVIEIYKGERIPKIISIYTARTTAACGFLEFEIEREYQIYLFSTSYFDHNFKNVSLDKNLYNGFWTNRCTRTRSFDSMEDRKLKNLKAQTH